MAKRRAGSQAQCAVRDLGKKLRWGMSNAASIRLALIWMPLPRRILVQWSQLRWNWFRFPFAKAARTVLREAFFVNPCRRISGFVISLPFDNCAILNLAF